MVGVGHASLRDVGNLHHAVECEVAKLDELSFEKQHGIGGSSLAGDVLQRGRSLDVSVHDRYTVDELFSTQHIYVSLCLFFVAAWHEAIDYLFHISLYFVLYILNNFSLLIPHS